jgi:uncharacterized protein (UPF0332 family)
MDKEFTENVINNAFRLWFIPEIERRKLNGIVPNDYRVWGAQVIMDLDNPEPIIHFNEEIHGVFRAEVLKKVKVGEKISLLDLERIYEVTLTEEDPNAGHLTVLIIKGVWYLSFDFRYNAARIAEYITISKQFLELADVALTRGYMNALVENLFAAVESLARCFLMMRPDKRILKSKKHRFISTQFNFQGKYENVPLQSVQLLNRLSELRPKARYPKEPFSLKKNEAYTLYQQAKHMVKDIEEIIPKRFGNKT